MATNYVNAETLEYYSELPNGDSKHYYSSALLPNI